MNDLEGMLTDLGGEVTGLEGQVSSLGGEVTDLGSTVGEACDQLTTLTQQSDDIVSGVTNVSLDNALQLINAAIQLPGLPGPLGSFQCE